MWIDSPGPPLGTTKCVLNLNWVVPLTIGVHIQNLKTITLYENEIFQRIFTLSLQIHFLFWWKYWVFDKISNLPVTPEDDLIKISEAVTEDSSVNPLSRLSAMLSLCFSSSDSSRKASISSISAMDSLRSSTNLDRSCSFRAFKVRTIFRSHFWASWIP